MTKPLWTRAEVLAATGGKAEGADWTAKGVSIDSRTLEPGDLFVAIKGENTDGHAYVEAALKRVLPKGWEFEIELVWEPPWSPALMSETARQQLGWDE